MGTHLRIQDPTLRVVLLSAAGPARDGGPGAGPGADGARKAAVLAGVQLPRTGGGAAVRLGSCMVLPWPIRTQTSIPAVPSVPTLLAFTLTWRGDIFPVRLLAFHLSPSSSAR